MRVDRSFLAAFARDLIELELGELDDASRSRTADWVIERMYGASEVARAGFVVVGGILALAVWAAAGRRYERLAADRRRALARRLAQTKLPIAADYVRAIRSLAVTYAFER